MKYCQNQKVHTEHNWWDGDTLRYCPGIQLKIVK